MRLALLSWLVLISAGGMSGIVRTQQAGTGLISGHMQNISDLFSVAVQTEVTSTATLDALATEVITNSATTTSTVPQSTPPPLPSASTSGPNLQLNPFDWNFQTSVPEPPIGPLAGVYIAFMLSLFWVCAYFYFFKRREWKRTNSVLKRATERWGQLGLWLAGIGLLFALFRVIHLDFFNLRFWLYFCALAALAAIVWFFYWYRNDYPKAMDKFLKTQRAKQYMPGAAKKSTNTPSVGPQQAQVGGKRRKK